MRQFAWIGAVWLLLLAGSILLPAGAASAQGTGSAIVMEMGERGAEYYFSPKELTVPAGTVRITFRNDGTRLHNWVVESLGQRTPDVPARGTYEGTYTFATPGTYDFICDLPSHAARGMIGRLIVSPAGAAPAAPVAPAAQATTAAPTAVAPAGQATTAPAAQATTAASTAAPAATVAGTRAAGSTTGSTTSAAPAAQSGTQSASMSPGGTPMFVSLAIHIPAAITWLGIVLYQALVGLVPYLSSAQRADLLQRPKWLAVATIPLFMITGIYQTIYNPFVTITDFETLENFRANSTYGLALFWKHGFVFLSMALTLAVSFWFAPRMAAVSATVATTSGLTITVDDAPESSSRLPALLTWANVASCLALLLCVAVIVYQLH